MPKAVCIVSGGLDSTGVAAYWKNREHDLYLLTFNYGQRASKELKRAEEMGKLLEARQHEMIDISFMKYLYGSTNVLTDETLEMPSQFQSNIIVPIRNAVFLTIATAYAFSQRAEVLAYGAHLTDQPYPDCRPEFATILEETLNLGDIDAINSGYHPPIKLWSPALAGLTKEALLKTSYSLLGDSIFQTWSCYSNGEKHCGSCESCRNRKIAFELATIIDKTDYEFTS